jgi:2-polyprenyl-3-methyl-5-hydroxy-6-metoxy-1,4-benzoquinol methylase
MSANSPHDFRCIRDGSSEMVATNQLVIPENTSKNTHNVVAQLLGEVAEGKVVLDLPCGEGAFTKRMFDSGADVFSADAVNIIQIPHAQFARVDMNQRLPYDDGMFDAVVCIDGIEHIERPFDFIRECQRILRQDGVLIISTPNLSALRSRWRYLLTGFHQGEKSPLDEARYTPLHHLSLVSFPELRYRLHANGFRVTAVRTNRVKFISWLYVLLAPLAYLVTVLAFNKEEKDAGVRKQNREIVRQMFTVPVLFGETLIVKATRI